MRYFPSIETTGIFWDYENVPLRHEDWDRFTDGLTNYINSNSVKYFKVYFRKNSPISERDFEILEKLPLIQFKEAENDDPNAVDDVLIQSCIDVLKLYEDINHVILISGDADFLKLLDQLHDWEVSITLICQEKNYNQSLISEGHRAFSVGFIAEHPQNWWYYR